MDLYILLFFIDINKYSKIIVSKHNKVAAIDDLENVNRIDKNNIPNLIKLLLEKLLIIFTNDNIKGSKIIFPKKFGSKYVETTLI